MAATALIGAGATSRVDVPTSKQKKMKDAEALFAYALLFRLYTIALIVLFVAFKFFLDARAYVNALLRGAQKETSQKKRAVVIGGGYAGTFTAMHLETQFDVTLIDVKNYFEFTPSTLRTFTDPNHSNVIQVPYSKFLRSTTFVEDRVDLIASDFVKTLGQQIIEFDYLVICTGSRQHYPKFPAMAPSQTSVEHSQAEAADSLHSTGSTVPQAVRVGPNSDSPRNSNRPTLVLSARAPNLHSFHPFLVAAKRILIIGGGTVGVELAAEIIDNFKDKEVSIVHSRLELMERNPPRAAKYAEKYFLKKGVNLLLGDRIIGHEGTLWKTREGRVVDADLALICTGNVPNSDLLRNETFGRFVNPVNGLVKVNQYLQLEGFPNIFVAGDLTDIAGQTEKLCQSAGHEAATAINNIRAMEAGKSLRRYFPAHCPMLISLGKYDGLLTYRGWTLTGFVPAAMKEFVEWKELVFYWDWDRFKPKRHHEPVYARTMMV